MTVNLVQILQKVMECNNVDMKVLSESDYAMEHLNPYQMLYSESEYKRYLTAWIKSIKEAVFYCSRDSYEIIYCVGVIPAYGNAVIESLPDDSAERQYLLIGPFLEYTVEEKELVSIMDYNHVPAQYAKELREFYNAVPIIFQAEQLIELCRQLFQLFYAEQNVQLEYLTYDFYDWEFLHETRNSAFPGDTPTLCATYATA